MAVSSKNRSNHWNFYFSEIRYIKKKYFSQKNGLAKKTKSKKF